MLYCIQGNKDSINVVWKRRILFPWNVLYVIDIPRHDIKNPTKIKIELGWKQIIISDKGRKKIKLRGRN